MRNLILVTVITLMVTCFAPAFAGEEPLVLAEEPVLVGEVVSDPLELADDTVLEIETAASEPNQVEYTARVIEIESAEVKPLAKALGTDVEMPKCYQQVVYTTQSSTLEGGYIMPTPYAVTAVPEPSSIMALVAGLGGVLVQVRRRKK